MSKVILKTDKELSGQTFKAGTAMIALSSTSEKLVRVKVGDGWDVITQNDIEASSIRTIDIERLVEGSVVFVDVKGKGPEGCIVSGIRKTKLTTKFHVGHPIEVSGSFLGCQPYSITEELIHDVIYADDYTTYEEQADAAVKMAEENEYKLLNHKSLQFEMQRGYEECTLSFFGAYEG